MNILYSQLILRQIDKQELVEFLATKVAKWWLPDDVQFVDAIPHTATGKILRGHAGKRHFTGLKASGRSDVALVVNDFTVKGASTSAAGSSRSASSTGSPTMW